jgi:hypothetical protein
MPHPCVCVRPSYARRDMEIYSPIFTSRLVHEHEQFCRDPLAYLTLGRNWRTVLESARSPSRIQTKTESIGSFRIETQVDDEPVCRRCHRNIPHSFGYVGRIWWPSLVRRHGAFEFCTQQRTVLDVNAFPAPLSWSLTEPIDYRGLHVRIRERD